MRRSSRWFRAVLLAAGLAVLWTTPTAGHGGPPRIELNAVRLPPGATLEVRGINLGADEVIRLALAGSAGTSLLGEVTGDSHGDCAAIFSLPSDLVAGVYSVQASAEGRLLASARLAIAGTAVSSDQQEGRRDQSEPLLAPMPIVQDSVGASVPPTPGRELSSASAPASPLAPAAPLWAAGLLAVLGLAGAWRYRQSRQA